MAGIFAVDGGQSAIRVRHSGDDKVVEIEGVSRLPDSAERVAEAVASAWDTLGRPSVDRAILGLTTAPADAGKAETLAARIGTTIQAGEVWLCDDAVTSHAAPSRSAGA